MDRASLDRIHIRDLRFRCIIGINDDERVNKQDVVVNITLYADLRAGGRSDDIADTVDYKSVKKRICAECEPSSYFLVEKLAQCIADICLDHDGVQRVRVLVEKPSALRFARSVGVEILRDRPE